MQCLRIIPKLDIKGPNLVKGIHLEGLRVLGRPETFARHYYENGADELIYMDVVASLYQRNSLVDIVAATAREIFIPLTVGGGLRSLDDIRNVLRAGADKVALNTAAINRPQLIQEASRQFGSSAIVISIEAILQPDGKYEAYTDNGRESTGVDAIEWAQQATELGAGELLVTSINKEGTGRGFDLELTRRISELVPIPVIACGGAGKISDVYDVAAQGKADAVCLASLIHYNFVRSQDSQGDDAGEHSNEGNTEFLRNRTISSVFEDGNIQDIKDRLQKNSISCRPTTKVDAHA